MIGGVSFFLYLSSVYCADSKKSRAFCFIIFILMLSPCLIINTVDLINILHQINGLVCVCVCVCVCVYIYIYTNI